MTGIHISADSFLSATTRKFCLLFVFDFAIRISFVSFSLLIYQLPNCSPAIALIRTLLPFFIFRMIQKKQSPRSRPVPIPEHLLTTSHSLSVTAAVTES